MKKSGLTIKIPRNKLEERSTYDRVREHLQKNQKYAYTRVGLMVEIYNRNAEDLNGPFSSWPKGAPTEYTRIRLTLEKLKNEGLIDSKKQGKKFLYWWKTAPKQT